MELIILFFIYLFGFYLVLKNPKKHFLLFFTLIIYFIYQFLGPLNTYKTDDYFIFGNNFKSAFSDTVFIYILAILSILIFYFIGIFQLSKKRVHRKLIYRLNPKSKYYLLVFFLAVSFIVSRKTSSEDADYSGGILNYLLFLADSLILGFLIFIYEGRIKKYQIVLLVITLIYYLVLGFRYRIILFLIGLIYFFFIKNKLSLKTVFKWFVFLIILIYTINFISINRNAFREADFSSVVFEAKVSGGHSPYDFFLAQTSNHKTDMSVVKYIENYNISPDFGDSMFLQIIYRIIPKSFFFKNEKPFIPQQEIIKYSFGSIQGFYAGAAVTNSVEYYIAFGYFGVVFFSGLIGFLMGYISRNINYYNSRDLIKIIIFAMFLFQEITRAYLPQNVTLLVFLLLTYKLFYIKQYDRNTN